MNVVEQADYMRGNAAVCVQEVEQIDCMRGNVAERAKERI